MILLSQKLQNGTFHDFVPIFGLTTGPHILYKVACVKPRIGTLTSLVP